MNKAQGKARNLKMAAIWISIMVIFIVELLFYTWCRVQCVQLGYAVSELTENQRRHQTMHNNLKIELARLKSPNRIVNIAKARLGLIMPTSEQIFLMP